MATSNPKQGIMQYWPQIFGIASFVFTAGIVYGKFGEMGERQKAVEARQDRQLELIQSQERRVIDLEKRTEYYKGLRDGRNESNGKKTTE